MSATDIQVFDKTEDKQEHYVVESGDSITSIAAKFDLTPSRLCQINKLRSNHLFAGQRLKVVKEESEQPKSKGENQDTAEEASEPEATPDIDTNAPSIEKRYRHIFRRIIGAEMLEKSHMAKVAQADIKETNDPLAAGCLKVEAKFCPELHTCVKGTLIATIETLMFSPLDESDQIAALCQSAVEMRYDSVRSVAAYVDASVFVFTKRPRLQRQYTHESNTDDSNNNTQSIHASSVNVIQHEEQALQENEVFLCCSVQRNRFTSGGGISPPACSPGAQWFIVSRKSVEDLDNFLVGSNLGFASVVPLGTLPEKSTSDKGEKECEKSRSIPSAIGSLIPRKMTLSFRNSQDSSGTSPQSYIGRSLGRLIHRTASTGQKNPRLNPTMGCGGGRRRPLSIGCSEELFSDHAAIDVIPQDLNKRTGGEDSEAVFFERSSSSTPSFADEKEVFDVLRQTSLLWELVSEQEFLQRCVLAEAEQEEGEEGCGSLISESAIFSILPPPAAIIQSTILATQTQIQEIFDSIPFAAQTFDWSLTFSTELHGFSLATLYRRCEEFASGDLEINSRFEGVRNAEDFTECSLIMRHKNLCCTLQHQPSVLLIKDTTEHVMGAYLNCHPRVLTGSFYGTGESFVFHWIPSPPTIPSTGDDLTVETVGNKSKSGGNLCFKKYSWSGKNSFFISGDSDVLAVGCSNGRSALRIDASLNRGRSEPCETFDNPELTPTGDFFIYALELWSLS
ncbi:unnamed protein product [Hymenolepis diminuta]|uniref:Oxidation resistance protein 1 n=1 Tax=Hymenolepis diminuta TaxID=6216 RepID=A0A564YS57_HYMDI|nr:unnamed protein product [Hymenolepis diminuta]